MESIKLFIAGLCVAGAMSVVSCKKNDIQQSPATNTTTSTTADPVKDSALLYSKDVYLWYNQIPATFNAQSYSDPSTIMTAIRQYSMETGFTAPVDRWSFAMKQSEWDNVSSGISGDFGLNVFFMSEGNLRVRNVERDSPAGKAGIKRGWKITKVNGSANITTANANTLVTAIYQSPSTSFTFQKPDNSSVDITLTAATYQDHPVILDTVYNAGSKRIGYFAFNSFLGDTTEIYNQFARIFNRFSSQTVSDVIIDLRYNGGGYVTVSQMLANYLVPAGAGNSLMMKQQYNDKYTQYNESTNFHKMGSLNLSRVFFIVSNNTASASELVINNLKPYMDVQLVGPSNTYGKPVGFFPIPDGPWYVFPVSFRSTNGAGQGSYFNGLTLSHQAADGLDQDWGSLNESSLASAVQYITSGAYRDPAPGIAAGTSSNNAITAEVVKGNNLFGASDFKGTVGKSHRF